jgi:hypothetical protein
MNVELEMIRQETFTAHLSYPERDCGKSISINDSGKL